MLFFSFGVQYINDVTQERIHAHTKMEIHKFEHFNEAFMVTGKGREKTKMWISPEN